MKGNLRALQPFGRRKYKGERLKYRKIREIENELWQGNQRAFSPSEGESKKAKG